MADADDPNGYRQQLERERKNITEKDEEKDEWRIPREQDREDLRLYAGSVEDRVDYSCAFNYLGRLRRLAETLDKPLRDCDVDDIKLAMTDLAEKNLGEGESYSSGTRRQYLRTVEDFGQERGIDALSAIEVPSVTQGKVDDDWVLSKSEVWDLIEAANKTRTKAVIAVCWECAWRATALLSLKVGDYEEPNDQYALMSVPVGVTGDKDAGGNKKPLTVARGYIDKWLDEHPCSDEDDAALFCRTDKERYYGDHMSSEAVRKQLNKAAKSADIDEDRVHIHCFRHARTTYMKKSPKYNDMDIEHMLDWSEGSNQINRYSHLNQDDKIASVLNAQGIEAETGSVDPEQIDCPRCSRKIPYDARNCPYCTVRVDDSPADWYTYYRQIVYEDDPVRQKYDNVASTTPAYANLPKSEFEHVYQRFTEAQVLHDAGQEGSDSALFDVAETRDQLRKKYDWPENIDISDLDHVDIDYISENWLSPTEQIARNYDLNTIEYELNESVTGLSIDELEDHASSLEDESEEHE